MIAITHPGKMGDAIFSLPVIKWLCEKFNTKADFWTSSYCAPLKEFFEYQSYINTFHVSPTYVIEHERCGMQPWFVPIPEENYSNTYHLGFRTTIFYPLTDFMASLADAPSGLPLKYEYPEIATSNEKYIVVGPRNDSNYASFIQQVSDLSITVVQVGAKGDKVSDVGIDCTGLNFLETVSWMSKAKAYFGPMSSQRVLAEGFDIPIYHGTIEPKEILKLL